MSTGPCDCVALRERVRTLEGVLNDLKRHNNHTIEEEMWRIDQALNQDSLGDGGKGVS